MPRAPKQCSRCSARIVGKTYCDTCQPVGWKSGASRTSTTEHKAWRKVVLSNCYGRCQINGPRCTRRALEADHIIPVAEGGAEYDPANGQGACVPCHKDKTQTEAARGRQRSMGQM